MAISTYPVQLMYNSGTTTPTWTKVVDIKKFPDLGGPPDKIEATTLSDAAKVYIAGIQDTKQLEFPANYTKTDYTTITGLTGTKDFQVWFGATGTDGKYQFSGTIMTYINGAGVSDIVEMTVVVTPSTVITPVTV